MKGFKDAVANDNIFVNILIPGETKPRIITYQVSASFGGAQKSSLPTHLVVKPNPNLEGSWAEFVGRMVNRDLDGALWLQVKGAGAMRGTKLFLCFAAAFALLAFHAYSSSNPFLSSFLPDVVEIGFWFDVMIAIDNRVMLSFFIDFAF